MSTVEFKRSLFNPGQWEFLRCTWPYVLMAGGVGSGKTTGLCAKMLQLRWINWGFPGLLVAPTWPMMKGVTLRELSRIYALSFPGCRKPSVRGPSGEQYLDFHDGGAPIFLRTAKNPGSIEGFNVGFAGGDEARWWSHEAYRNFIARVRMRAPLTQSVLSSTPSLGWMADEFNAGKTKRKLITAPTLENVRNLRPDYIDDLKASFSPRVVRAILNGEFIAMEGVVYDAFDGQLNSPWITDWQPTAQDLQRLKVYLAVDPGWRRSSWIFIVERYQHKDGPPEWVVFDQLTLDNTSDMTAVEMVNQRGYPIDEIWVDPAGDNTQSATGYDTFAVLRHVKARTDDTAALRTIANLIRLRHIPWGIDKLRLLLGGYEGYPIRIRFTRELVEAERGKPRGVVRSLSNYAYPEVKDGRPVTDIPLKDGLNDHDCDAMRYFAIGRVLTVPELRSRDPDLCKDKRLGYKIAA